MVDEAEVVAGATRLRWNDGLRLMLTTGGSLLGTVAVTSGIGFVFWFVAARGFPAASVGLAAAAVSAMTLLASFSNLGMGTLLIRELARHEGRESVLISTALAVTTAVGILAGASFAFVAPYLGSDLVPLGASLPVVLFFAAGVGLTSAAIVTDQALLGLLRSPLQLARNVLQSVLKLAAIVAVATLAIDRSGLLIYGTWVVATLVSLIALAALAFRRGLRLAAATTDWSIVRRLGRSALNHHALNLSLQFPSLGLPVLVTILGSATLNATFYIAWLLASVAFLGPIAVAQTLYAIGARSPDLLWHRMRVTLVMAFGLALAALGVLAIAGGAILALFGDVYADAARTSSLILTAGALPLIVKDHYHVTQRIRDRAGRAAAVCTVGGLLELALAGVGARLGGLTGLSVGWLAAVCIEALITLGPLIGVARAARAIGRAGRGVGEGGAA
jgi:O-antigen/teichoic acid export membrane protein